MTASRGVTRTYRGWGGDALKDILFKSKIMRRFLSNRGWLAAVTKTVTKNQQYDPLLSHHHWLNVDEYMHRNGPY
jgi:hypothetical protein